MSRVKRIGLLTAGGDCPGLNAVIRAVTKSAAHQSPSIEVIGIQDGYAGLVEDRVQRLDDAIVSGLLFRGGTILGTSNRDNPFKYQSPLETTPRDRSRDALKTVERERLDALIAVGGDGTLRCALELGALGVPAIGIPKTIDNDLGETDVTFGFNSALTIATDAVDRLHTTAESHHRVLICEVMGRYAGWIALHAGIAGGGDVILIPEIPYDIRKVAEALKARVRMGKHFSIIVVAEGAKPAGGKMVAQGLYKGAGHRMRLGGISHQVAKEIETASGLETRVVILGHLQRGGIPTAFDRWLATSFGVRAVELAAKGRWGRMAALHGTEVTDVPIQDAVRKLRRIDPQGQGVHTARLVGTSFGN